LRKCHAEELIEARKGSRAIIAPVFADAPIEIAFRQEADELGEEEPPGMHRQVLSRHFSGKDYGNSATEVEIDTGKKSS